MLTNQMLENRKMPNGLSVISTRFDPDGSCQCCKLRKTCVASRMGRETNKVFHQVTHRSLLIKHGEHLFYNGDPLRSVYIVKSGSFKSYIINHRADEQIINFHLPGDILGFEALPSHLFESSVVALETASVCAIPVWQLEKMIEQLVPDWLMEIFMEKLKLQNRTASALGKKDARRRIASFLWDISENYQALGYSGKNIKLNMSRQDIGNYLGLASETISRIFTKMKKDGLLKLNRRDVTIIDFDLLSELADKDVSKSNI